MKKLVLYDSLYGNTEKIAQEIAKGISTKVIKVTDSTHADINQSDIIIIGSPTQGGRATETIQKFISNLSSNDIKGKRIAVFDTRLLESDLNFALKLLVKTIGYAAPKMAKMLTDKGGTLIAPPEGFIVKGKDGPLKDGELKRAKNWITL